MMFGAMALMILLASASSVGHSVGSAAADQLVPFGTIA